MGIVNRDQDLWWSLIFFRVVVSFGVARITFHVYVDLYHALTRTEYAWNLFSCDFWHTFSFLPDSLSLFYSMISSEGEFRNGKKYAELVYLLPISGNSGVQKRMELRD